MQTDGTSYNEDEASTMACGGSVMEARSLAESASSNLPHLSVLSRERDISPTYITQIHTPFERTIPHSQSFQSKQPCETSISSNEQILIATCSNINDSFHKQTNSIGNFLCYNKDE